MTIDHPENFDDGSAIPIDDKYVDDILNSEFGIPDGLADVTPRVDIARRIHELVLALDRDADDSEDKFAELVLGVQELRTGKNGEYDNSLTLHVLVRLSRVIEALLAMSRDLCCDEDDDERRGAEEFDAELREIFDEACEKIANRRFDAYWDRSRRQLTEGFTTGAESDEDRFRTFRFTFSHDVECESVDLALIELAEVVSTMLEPNSVASAWTVEEFDDVVLLDDDVEPVSRRQLRLGANSARLKGFLGLMEQSEFVFE